MRTIIAPVRPTDLGKPALDLAQARRSATSQLCRAKSRRPGCGTARQHKRFTAQSSQHRRTAQSYSVGSSSRLSIESSSYAGSTNGKRLALGDVQQVRQIHLDEPALTRQHQATVHDATLDEQDVAKLRLHRQPAFQVSRREMSRKRQQMQPIVVHLARNQTARNRNHFDDAKSCSATVCGPANQPTSRLVRRTAKEHARRSQLRIKRAITVAPTSIALPGSLADDRR